MFLFRALAFALVLVLTVSCASKETTEAAATAPTPAETESCAAVAGLVGDSKSQTADCAEDAKKLGAAPAPKKKSKKKR